MAEHLKRSDKLFMDETTARADPRAAMKEGRGSDAGLIRTLIAAIDNAEAPPVAAGDSAIQASEGAEGLRRRIASYGTAPDSDGQI